MFLIFLLLSIEWEQFLFAGCDEILGAQECQRNAGLGAELGPRICSNMFAHVGQIYVVSGCNCFQCVQRSVRDADMHNGYLTR